MHFLDHDPAKVDVETVAIDSDAIDLVLKKAGLTRADVGPTPPEVIVPYSGVLHLRFEALGVTDVTNGKMVCDTWGRTVQTPVTQGSIIIPFIYDMEVPKASDEAEATPAYDSDLKCWSTTLRS